MINCTLSWNFDNLAFFATFAGLAGYAAISDIRGFRIPNTVSIALILLFLVRYLLLAPPVSVKAHLAVAAASFGILFFFYLAGWFGAGDAKLITAVMLWAGPEAGVPFILVMVLSGGVFAALLLALGKALRLRPQFAGYVPSPRVRRWAERGICPYGLPIFAAALWVSPAMFNAWACNPA